MSDPFEFSIPVLVVGGGACGCIAALAADEAGAQVLLLEQDARPMGSSGMSQGLICAAGTASQAAHGVVDDAERYYADIMAKTRGQTDPRLARAIAENAGPTVDWMVEALDMPWRLDTGFRPAYGNTTFRVHGWKEHTGQDMVDLLHRRLDDRGIAVMTGARLVQVHDDGAGKVLGVTIERPDGTRESFGCEALILACGGFAANHEMVAQYMPEMAAARNNGHESSQGTSVRVARQLGGAVADMGAYQGYAMLTEPHGIPVPPGVPVAGGVLVNTQGHRFTDETEDIAGMVHPVLAQDGGPVWVIYDDRIQAAVDYIPEIRQLDALNAPRRAPDIAALARAIGVPVENLTQTLAEAHRAQAQGRPDGQGRTWGDDLPPQAGYRALKVVGAIFHTQGGPQIDGNGRVLKEDGTPLPNLFAGGGAARSVSGPAHWGYLPAMGLATAVTFGRLAGRTAATLVKAPATSTPA